MDEAYEECTVSDLREPLPVRRGECRLRVAMAAVFFKLDTWISRELVDDLKKVVTRCCIVPEFPSALGIGLRSLGRYRWRGRGKELLWAGGGWRDKARTAFPFF